jgi:GNAT superfamily N-acetyltransferase
MTTAGSSTPTAAAPLPAEDFRIDCKGRALWLRAPRTGDMGWVVHRHGALYGAEYGWDWTFEALVAQVASEFILKFKPERDRGWIAELDGRVVGSAFVVERDKEVAKLRLVYVEPEVRGLGISRRLLEASLTFASAAGYTKMLLWTNRNLVAARGLYASAGFRMIHEEPYRGFGHDLVGETWERALP